MKPGQKMSSSIFRTALFTITGGMNKEEDLKRT